MKNIILNLHINPNHYLRLHHNLYLTLTVSLTLLSCSPALMNLDSAKDEVAKYYESGQYAEELTEIIEDAKQKFSEVKPTPNSAVIFDIDETALDNYKEIKRIGFGYERQLWEEWLQKAEAPSIPQVKELYDFLIERRFKVVFITGKKDYQYNATFKNMIKVGYTMFDTIITRNKDEYKVKSAQYKSNKRNELAGKGYVIAGCVGDQLTDCEGENCGIVVKLPNYLYLVD